MYLIGDTLMLEIWKDIENYENLYQVSNLGRVRSLDRYVNAKNGMQIKNGRVKKYSIGNTGYKKTILSHESARKTFNIHRLVASAFCTRKDCHGQVNHINGNKLDNRSINLEWCTASENSKHAFAVGLRSVVGVKNPSSKLTECDVLEIDRMLKSGYKQQDIAEMYFVTQSAISAIKNRKKWKHLFNEFEKS